MCTASGQIPRSQSLKTKRISLTEALTMKLASKQMHAGSNCDVDSMVDFRSACNLDGWIGYLLDDQSRERVGKMQELYNQNHFASPDRPRRPENVIGIPRILHQVWFGPQMPDKFQQQTQSWKKHHPDWEYRLWTDRDVNELGADIADLINSTECYGQKGDILRMAILQKHGGLYVDVDYDCFRPCDVINQSFDFCTTMRGFPILSMQFPDAFPSPLGICSSMTAAIPNHPILNSFLDKVGERMDNKELIGQPSRLPFWGKINRMRVAIKSCYQLYQEVFAEVAGTTGHVDIALPPTFFNPIDTWWWTRTFRPAFYARLLGYLRHKSSYPAPYNLTHAYPYSFGHHDSQASWL